MQERPFDPFLPPVSDEEAAASGLPQDADAPEGPEPKVHFLARRAVRIPLFALGLMVLIGVVLVSTGSFALTGGAAEEPTEDDLPVVSFDPSQPFTFTGLLRKVTVTMDEDQALDGEAVGAAEMARQ